MRSMMGAGRVMGVGVHCMRQCRCNDVELVARMRQKEKCWWYAFGVVVILWGGTRSCAASAGDARPKTVSMA